MKIDEAINVLENEVRVSEINDRPLEVKAFNLGIEALKEVRASREEDYIGDTGLLPGEIE